jgi:hypothetical protein
MKHTRRSFLALGTAGAVTTGLKLVGFGSVTASAASPGRQAGPSTNASADVAWQWFELLYDLVKAERMNPARASRVYGLAAVSLYESVVNGSPHHRSLAAQLNGTETFPAPLGMSVDWPCAANAALRESVDGLMPNMSEASSTLMHGLAESFDAESKNMLPRQIYERSVGYGRTVAASVLEWSSTDGVDSRSECEHSPSGESWGWAPTPPGFLPALEPCWGKNRPMALGAIEEFAAPGHPDPSSEEFEQSALKVYEVGLNLSSEERAIAEFWDDSPGNTGTPPGHWVAIVSQLTRNEGLSLMTAAEAYARVGIAVHDAFICCWHDKYVYDLLRPVTYIRRHVDPQWSSHLVTPPFPTYTSGHSTQSGAAAAVLTDMFGAKPFTDTTHVDHNQGPATARIFESFEAAAHEAMVSRLYGGIHFDFDNLDGLDAGNRIGRGIVQRIVFRPIDRASSIRPAPKEDRRRVHPKGEQSWNA